MSKFVGDDAEAEAFIRCNNLGKKSNPWLCLPTEPPYVLPEDKETIENFNAMLKQKDNSARYLHVDKVLPEPWIGNVKAPVLLLSNNPGFSGEEADKPRQQPFVLEWMRKNLRHEQLDYPFYYLDPAFKRNDWWDKKLHYLIEHFDRIGYDGRKLVARSVLNVAYFPYPSRNFGHLCIPLDAQKYGFSLVREALERDAVIIHMRRADIWEPKVQGLSECKRRFQVPNTQTPVITPHCPGFKEAIEAIKTFAATPAASK